MNKRYNPERGFFIGKFSKYLASGALLAVFLVPVSVQAQIMPITTASTPVDSVSANNASSIISTVGIQGAQNVSMPAVQANFVWVTAYTSVPDETDDSPFYTANGAHVRDGIIAANWLPFGTQVKIPALFGNKIFTVEDRMNPIFNQRADIWMPTINQALNFGIQHVEVVVISEPQYATLFSGSYTLATPSGSGS